MAIIDPEGLFEGERLAACSDIAQLYWQRLFLAANSCGRMQMTYPAIISKVFKTFQNPPTEPDLWAVFEELERHFLTILYEVDGVWWCQFVTSEKFLPKYKKARDEASPAPSHEMIEFHAEGYRSWKKQNSFKNQSFRKSSEHFQRRGIGIGEVVGEVIGEEEERRGKRNGAPTEPTPPPEPEPIKPEAVSEAVIAIICAHPKSQARNLKPNEVRQRDQIAVLEAMGDEQKASGASPADCLLMMLERTEMLADKVPRSEWRFFKDVSEFYRNHDYRLQPEDFTRSNSNGKNIGDSRSAAVRRVKNTDANWDSAIGQRLAGADGRDAETGISSVPSPGVSPRDNGSVPADVRGPGAGVRIEAPRDGAPIATEPPEILSPSQRSPRGA